MRIATLQFSPRVGEVQDNISQAESLLHKSEGLGQLKNLDLLVLPEMAFSGYNYPSLEAIKPYLEPTASGISTNWAVRTAIRLQCTVAVGYPEMATTEGSFASATEDVTAYNSLVFVACEGNVVAHYRKTFLYYSDEPWAQEGPAGFFKGSVPIGQAKAQVSLAAGICMDINPYRFESPWTAYEFANHCREAQAKVVIVSAAWLTRLTHEEVFGLDDDVQTQDVRRKPDIDTVTYWIERFRPLLQVTGSEDEVIVIFANRAGEEGTAPRVGEVRYAGSSSVMGMRQADGDWGNRVRIWDMMGRAENGVLMVDTDDPPLYSTRREARSQPIAEDDAG